MYDFLKQAITSHTYTDLTAMTAKVDKAWAMSTITDDERAELEALRAQQAKMNQAAQEAAERRELENLRKAQKYAKEDAEYYAEKQRRKEQRAYEREHPDYSLDDLEPMPMKQKILIGVFALGFVLLIIYIIWFNVLN